MSLFGTLPDRFDQTRQAIEEEGVEPDKRTVRRYLRDADYPAKQQELVSVADSKGAPTALLERLKNLQGDAEFSGPDEVLEALEGQDVSFDHVRRSRRGNP